jgi:hypothetical protein
MPSPIRDEAGEEPERFFNLVNLIRNEAEGFGKSL